MRGEKFADQPLFLLVFDAGEEFRAELADRFRLVEGEFVVHLASLKMTGLATRLKYRFDLFFKVRFGSKVRRRKPRGLGA